MSRALGARLTGLRTRLDALPSLTAASGAARVWAGLRAATTLQPLEELSEATALLDRLGIHASADARLFASVAAGDEKKATARRIVSLAERALKDFEDALAGLEWAARAGAPVPGGATALDRAFAPLARVAKTADLFSRAEPPEAFELFERSPSVGLTPSTAEAIAACWVERARSEEGLGQKRRLYDRAHELLLRASAETETTSEVTRKLKVEIGAARQRLKTLEGATSLQELVDRTQGRPERAYPAAKALYELAVDAGAAEAASRLFEALEPLARSAAAAEVDPELADLAYGLDAERKALFELAAGCGGFFDVEDALGGEEEVAQPPVLHRVPYPTDRMSFDFAQGLHQLQNFVISDPRRIVYDLASGQQLSRVYLEERAPEKKRKLRRTAVRVYVCDASGSMSGDRAKFRDALLIAELENLRQRARADQSFVPLYYAYFTDVASDLWCVDDADEAVRHLRRLFGRTPAKGRTDITMALISAFDAIRAAHGKDPYLARATVVLVTDGEDKVDLEVIEKMRAPLGRMEIALSFISLGGRNRDLERLVQEQRRSGVRAFYQHLSDDALASVKTEFDTARRTVLPAHVALTPELAAGLRERLARVTLPADRPRPVRAAGREVSFDAFFPEPPREPKSPPSELHTRAATWLDAVAEATSLTSLSERPRESVELLEHLLRTYGIAVPAYLECAAAPSVELAASLARLRRICRPMA